MRTPWVLLRGLTREAGHWGPFLPLLRQQLPEGTPVLTPDLAGNGHRFAELSATCVSAMALDVRRQLQSLEQSHGWAPPYRVVAMSLGAMVAVAWQDQWPQEVASATLINTSLRPFNPFWQRLQPRQYLRLMQMLTHADDASLLEASILAMTTQSARQAGLSATRADAETLAAWLDLRTRHPVQARNALRQLWAAARYRAPAQPPRVPTLLLHSLGDALVAPACTTTLAKAWRCPVRTHPWAGHDLPHDDGHWVVEHVLAWLKASGQTTRSSGR